MQPGINLLSLLLRLTGTDCWFDSQLEPDFLASATFPPIIAKSDFEIFAVISTCITVE